MTARQARRVNRAIEGSRRHAAAGSWVRTLRANRRAVRMLGGDSGDPVALLVNAAILAQLYYEQAQPLHELGHGEAAIAAAERATDLYTRVDPTCGDPGLVEAAIRDHRRGRPGLYTGPQAEGDAEEFDARIGDAANAVSQLALLLALHRGRAESKFVEWLATQAIDTYTTLAQVSPHYGAEELNRVIAQVNQARQLLLR